MSITDRIPALRGTGSRRAVDKVEQLRDENRRLLTITHRAGDEIALLKRDLTEARTLQADAELAAVQLQADNADLTHEVRALRAELANRDAVTVPPMERDTSNGADQATAPIDVRSLREAADAGLLSPVIRISTAGASANPGLPPAA